MTRASPKRLGAPTQWLPERDAELCEHIANGVSITGAGRLMGITRCAAIGRFQRIRGHFGWQAA